MTVFLGGVPPSAGLWAGSSCEALGDPRPPPPFLRGVRVHALGFPLIKKGNVGLYPPAPLTAALFSELLSHDCWSQVNQIIASGFCRRGRLLLFYTI